MKPHACLLLLFFAFLFFSAGLARAQTGLIEGTVRDDVGAPLPGVNVVLQGTQTGTATDGSGRFRLPGIAPGVYTVEASAVGFRRTGQTVTLNAGETVTLDFVLTEVVLTSGEVVITASRRAQLSSSLSVSLSVMTPRELELRNIVALDDALRYVPGVQLQENQVNIRGSSGFAYNTGSRVLLLLDGVPILTPDSDGMPFDALPFAQIAQVEVLKGPGSALYGSGALGGVVHVLTKAFPETPETSVRLFGGLYEPVRYDVWRDNWEDAESAHPLGGITVSHARRFSDKAGLWINLAYRADAGYMNFNMSQVFQGYAKIGVQLRPALRLDVLTGLMTRKKDSFLFWNGGRDALNPGTLSIGQNSAAGDSPSGTNDNVSNQISFLPTLTHVVNSRVFYTVKARVFGSVIQPIDDITGKPRPLDDGTLGFRYGGEVQVNYKRRPGQHLTAGIAGDANTTNSSFFVSTDGDKIGRQPEGAVFAQWEQDLSRRLHLVGGLRFDAYRIDASETVTRLSPKLSTAYRLSDAVTLRAAYGHGFRVPSLAERFTDNQDFFPVVRNLTLRPERSTSYEVGLRGLLPLASDSGVQLDAALFWNEYTGLIEPKFVPALQAFQFINLTRARIRGVEAALDVSALADRIKLRIGYTLLDADDLTTGEPLAYRPRHLLLTALDTRIYGPIEAGLDYRYASRPSRVDSDFTLFVRDADLLVATRVLDLRLSTRHRGFRAALLLKNALQYYYLERPALLAPPRHLLLQLQVDF